MNKERQNPPRIQHHPQDPFDLLTDDSTLLQIFEYVGPYHFRFVAGVSRRWRRLYTQFQQAEFRKREPKEEDFLPGFSFSFSLTSTALIAKVTSLTSTAAIAESLSQAKIFLSDTGTNPFERILKIQKNGSQEVNDLDTRQSFDYLRKVAVQYGHVEILQLAIANGCTCNKWTCVQAAQEGQLNVLKYLRTNGCPWDEYMFSQGAENGHLELLQWARENGCPWDEDTCAHAATGGHLEVLRWARENGCPWDEDTCAHAATGGHLEVLQWARENGCPWDESTCDDAALGGHLEVLQWARTNGCPWNDSTCRSAALFGHLEALQWAIENGCEWNHLGENWPRNVMDWLQGNELRVLR